MIKAVLFDYGGVLAEGGTSGSVARLFAKVYGIDPSAMDGDEDVFLRSRQGTITQQAFFDEMNRRHPHGPRMTEESYILNADIFVKSPLIYDFAAQLRQQGIVTGILSNINDTIANELRRRGHYDGFEPVILSCEEQFAKPQSPFYEIAIKRLGLLPGEVVLVDDQEKCRPPAIALGMHFVLAVSPQQIIDDTMAVMAKENSMHPTSSQAEKL